MSTKIHTGFRINQDVPLFDFLGQAKVALDAVQADVDVANLGADLARAVDKFDTETNEEEDSEFRYSFLAGVITADRTTQGGHKRNDVNGWVNFFAHPQTGQHYGVVDAHQQSDDFVTALSQIVGYQEYGYWNNTDKPDEISEEGWRQRRLDWDQVIPWGPAPAFLQFTTRFDDHTTSLVLEKRKDTILAAVPTVERRAHHYANRLILNDLAAQKVSEQEFYRLLFDVKPPQDMVEFVASHLRPITWETIIESGPAKRPQEWTVQALAMAKREAEELSRG